MKFIVYIHSVTFLEVFLWFEELKTDGLQNWESIIVAIIFKT